MKVSIIGTNGLLGGHIGAYCNSISAEVISYGNTEPRKYKCSKFYPTNLLVDPIDILELSKSDIIVYASGAGIQSNANESFETIYKINSFVPIQICKHLSEADYRGTLITFGSYFEIGNNPTTHKFSESEV